MEFYFVKGSCELENGNVFFQGGFNAVSLPQAWYFCIYALRDAYTDINYWIAPNLESVNKIKSNSLENSHRVFRCEFVEFKDKNIRPKQKLSFNETLKLEKGKNKYLITQPTIEFGPIETMTTFEDLIESNDDEYVVTDYYTKDLINLNYGEDALEIFEREVKYSSWDPNLFSPQPSTYCELINLSKDRFNTYYEFTTKSIATLKKNLRALERNLSSTEIDEVFVVTRILQYRRMMREIEYSISELNKLNFIKTYCLAESNPRDLSNESMLKIHNKFNEMDGLNCCYYLKNIIDSICKIKEVVDNLNLSNTEYTLDYIKSQFDDFNNEYYNNLANLKELHKVGNNDEFAYIYKDIDSQLEELIYLIHDKSLLYVFSLLDEEIQQLFDDNRRETIYKSMYLERIIKFIIPEKPSQDDMEFDFDDTICDYEYDYDDDDNDYSVQWLEDMCNLPEGVGLFDDDR